jgi:hypothetical protein
LVDRQRGETIAITLWEDEQAMRASEESANALRADAAGQMGATEAPKVARYEVAVFEVLSPDISELLTYTRWCTAAALRGTTQRAAT